MLDNGLVILAARTPAEDLVTLDIKILAGSAAEGRYLGSGISHFVEHMVFKGTRSRGPGEIDKEVKSLGGIINGSSSMDLVNYHITLPSKGLPSALAILKDMLLNASFDPAEVEREREVILSEIRMNNDDPQARLMRILNRTAYTRHPYRHPPIGYEPMLKALKRDDLVNFYNSSYVPNRMVITITGGIDPLKAVESAENEFKNFRAPDYGGAHAMHVEPVQLDKRSYAEEIDTTLAYMALGFHSSAITDEDLYAADVLSMILGRGDNSRLNTAVYKKKGLVHTVAAWNYTPRDPGLFVITAIADPENIDKAELAILDEIELVKSKPVADDELEGARRTVLSDYIYQRETTEGLADDIGTSYILTGSPGFSRRYIDGVRAVTKDDIQRVAKKYLISTNLTEVRMVPRGAINTGAASAIPAKMDKAFEKMTLDNGLRVLIHKNDASPSVSITVAAIGGVMAEDKGNNGISSLVSRMIFKGTKTRKESELIGAIQKMGGSADSFSSMSSLGFTIKCLKEDIDGVLAICKDVITNATFPEDELEKEKGLTLAMIKEEDDDILQRGMLAVRRGLFPGSPYGMRYLGEPGSVMSLTRPSLVSFYDKYYAPGNMAISISGDIDKTRIQKMVTGMFSDMGRSGQRMKAPDFPGRSPGATVENITMKRDESLVMSGFRSATLKDPERFAMEVAASVMSGQSGRMFDDLRDKHSLAYSLGCFQKSSMSTGFFVFYAATSKERISEVRKAIAKHILTLRSSPVSDDELLKAKREIMTGYRIALQSNDYISLNAALEELCGAGCESLFSYGDDIKRVSADDVKRCAAKYLGPDALVEAIVSPP